VPIALHPTPLDPDLDLHALRSNYALMEAGRQPNSVGTEAVAAKNATHSAGSPELADTHAIRKMFNQLLQESPREQRLQIISRVYLFGDFW
jgi:hypothetical protein